MKCSEIEKLGMDKLSAISDLIRQVALSLQRNGIDQWDELYPDKTDLESDLRSGCAFGYYSGKQIAGYIVLNEDESEEYRTVEWTGPDDHVLVIHRLSVSPEIQGRGIGRILLCFAEDYGRKYGYKSIRLDAFPVNEHAIHLYEHNGYSLRGTVMYRKGMFNCYEKML